MRGVKDLGYERLYWFYPRTEWCIAISVILFLPLTLSISKALYSTGEMGWSAALYLSVVISGPIYPFLWRDRLERVMDTVFLGRNKWGPFCERCGRGPHPEGGNFYRIIPKRFELLRWAKFNTLYLCGACAKRMKREPVESDVWLRGYIGEERYGALKTISSFKDVKRSSGEIFNQMDWSPNQYIKAFGVCGGRCVVETTHKVNEGGEK